VVTSKDIANDAHTGVTGNVGDDVVKLDVGQRESLLHLLDQRASRLDQIATVAQVGAELQKVGVRTEASS